MARLAPLRLLLLLLAASARVASSQAASGAESSAAPGEPAPAAQAGALSPPARPSEAAAEPAAAEPAQAAAPPVAAAAPPVTEAPAAAKAERPSESATAEAARRARRLQSAEERQNLAKDFDVEEAASEASRKLLATGDMTGGGDGPGVVYVKAGSIYRANIMTVDGPRFTQGPEVVATTPTTFTLKLAMDVPGIAYAVVVPDGAAAPSCAQVSKRQKADGAAAHATGFAMVPKAETAVTFEVGALHAGDVSAAGDLKAWDIYVCGQDSSTTGVNEDPNVVLTADHSGDTLVHIDVYSPFPWANDGALEGFPQNWPLGILGESQITGGGLTGDILDLAYTKKQTVHLAEYEHGHPEKGILDMDGAPIEAPEFKHPTVSDERRRLLEARYRVGHVLVQWDVQVVSQYPIQQFDYNSILVSGCFVSDFTAIDTQTFNFTLTACDSCGKSQTRERESSLKYKQYLGLESAYQCNRRLCTARVPSNAYVLAPPNDACDVTEHVAGGGTSLAGCASCTSSTSCTCTAGTKKECTNPIVNKQSEALELGYDEFVAPCMPEYSARHASATSVAELAEHATEFTKTMYRHFEFRKR